MTEETKECKHQNQQLMRCEKGFVYVCVDCKKELTWITK
jgi:hypothetical protein